MRMKLANTRRSINWLIALMTVSLMGITGIQAYWLTNSYHLEEDKFDHQVAQALQNVSRRLETLETINFLYNNFRLEPLFSAGLNQISTIAGKGDTVFGYENPQGSYRVRVSMSDDSIRVLEGRTGAFQENGFRDTSYKAPIGEDQKMAIKLKRINAVFNQLILNSLNRRMSLKNRMSKEMLDSILDFELKSNGIDLPYQYSVVENDHSIMHTGQWKEEQPYHQAALFPNDFFGHRALLVTFEGKRNYLLSSMWLTLLVSLIFTSAIIFTFARTLSYTLQQKRISDIKTDFINNMTHEFKTPIATINLAIDALKSPKVIHDPARIEHYSRVIKQENNRMNLQVESVLRMALMDKKELDLNFEPVEISEMLQECIAHVQLALESKGGHLESHFYDHQACVMADKNHLSNTIINILDNAMKYSVDTPDIKVVTEVTRDSVILIISDKGIGMTRDEQKHIFDRFYRVSSGNIHNIKGHGLGLSYARGIIEAHDGKIEVESEKGKGSKFYIYLPLITDKET